MAPTQYDKIILAKEKKKINLNIFDFFRLIDASEILLNIEF
jgi:hypothetical protein